MTELNDGVLGKSKYTLGQELLREHFHRGQPHSGMVLLYASSKTVDTASSKLQATL